MTEGFMKAMPAKHAPCDYSKFEDTEFSLAISPCPRIEESKDICAEFAHERSGLQRRGEPQLSPPTVFDEHRRIEALTIAWAIALAIALAVAIHASAG